MKVILNEDVAKLGKAGEIVEVKPGYANNFLFRRDLAIPYNKKNANDVKTKQAAILARKAKEQAAAQELADQIEGKELEIPVKCGEQGRLYGSITSMDVAEKLLEQGYEIDKRGVTIEDSIKECGVYDAEIKLYSGITAQVKLNVVPLGE